MARKSTKEHKNLYQRTREALDLTREKASELLVTLSPERIEKIESERSMPHPDEVLLMSDQYKQPSLCNYYCANQCPIGRQYVPEIKIKDLSQIVLETIASLNAMQKRKERLIEITVDGRITGDELADFVYIQEELEKISAGMGIDLKSLLMGALGGKLAADNPPAVVVVPQAQNTADARDISDNDATTE